MSIPNIDGIGRLAPTAADTPASGAPGRPVAARAVDDGIALGQAPKPLRFPWLSRLSQQLESASKQRPAFSPAPVLGDNVNKSA